MNAANSVLFSLALLQYWDDLCLKIGYGQLQVSPTVTLWIHRYRSRRQMACLTAERLDDLGLTIEQVREEVKKPFWR
ncbi:MAG: hypothetical protein ACI9D5_001279 [Candidatus Endobugula sp.]|jgi:uncharacterized protein YjiS (DUF1127 family)